jgi:hypothetical protein
MNGRKPAAFRRRGFLQMAGAGVGASFLGTIASNERVAHADPPWSPRPSSSPLAGDPEYKILEVFLYGGLSPWETFCIRSGGAWTDWRGSRPAFGALSYLCGSVGPTDTQAFGDDMRGNDVWLGPATSPLWSHLDRLRVLTMRHDLLPHEAAVPYALAGLKLGNPRMAGIGAPIQRRFFDATNPLPRSYIIFPPAGTITIGDNLIACSSLGQHPGYARPLVLTMGSNAVLTQLERDGAAAHPGRDDLLRHYRDAYRHELRWSGGGPHGGKVLRSKHWDAYEGAVNLVMQAPALHALLTGTSFANAPPTICGRSGGVDYSGSSHTGSALAAAAYLLSQSTTNYVGVIDGGIQRTSGATYDVHAGVPQITSFNLFDTLRSIANLVASGALDLDTTMVVFNTEFGRTPGSASAPQRDHFPNGYTVALLGGPIGYGGRANGGFAGAFHNSGETDETVVASTAGGAFTPTDLQGAVLLAAGVNPLDPEAYANGDFGNHTRNAINEAQTATNLAQRVLGVS